MSAIPRLTRRPEFLRVAATRKKWVAPGLIVQALKRDKEGAEAPARVGFTVSRKVGNAVKRNRARRRLRAAVDIVMGKQDRAGYDFVVIGRKVTLVRPFKGLLDDLETALKKLDA